MYEIDFTRTALDDLRYYRKYERNIILEATIKLKQTFDYETWNATVETSTKTFAERQSLLEAQLKQLQVVMDNLVSNLASLSTPQLIAAVEKRYQEAQIEHTRLQRELDLVKANTADIERIRALKNSFSTVLENWEQMNADQKREVVHVFVDRIVATVNKTKDDFQLSIEWKDGSSDQLKLQRVAATGTIWLSHEVTRLLELVESGVSKIEIAKAFPDRQWGRLYTKYNYLTGKSFPREHRNSISKYETYNEYMERLRLNGSASSTFEPSSTTKFGTAAAPTAASVPATLPRQPTPGASSATSITPL